jgi:hypothetical protein
MPICQASPINEIKKKKKKMLQGLTTTNYRRPKATYKIKKGNTYLPCHGICK